MNSEGRKKKDCLELAPQLVGGLLQVQWELGGERSRESERRRRREHCSRGKGRRMQTIRVDCDRRERCVQCRRGGKVSSVMLPPALGDLSLALERE